MNALEVKRTRESLNLSQLEFATMLGKSVRAVQSWEQGTRNIPSSVVILINNITQSDIKHNTDFNPKEFALKQLSNIKKTNKGEGRLIDESELVPVEQYIIPIKGQAGLKKAFFYPDEYVEKNFEKELAYVRPKDRAVYHKIEVDGGSMPGVLNPGEWARCVEIPKILWLDKGTFKPDKIYCLWHKDLGILFKRISKVRLDVITLSSDNTDKNDYPDQDFQLIEFSKILIVKMKEVIL